MATASEIWRALTYGEDYDPDEELDCSDEAIEANMTRIDNIIKHFHSPHPLDASGRPIPPPPDLTSKVDSGKIRERKQRKNKHAKR